MASKTYYVGYRSPLTGPTSNVIKRLDDFTAPWVDLSSNFFAVAGAFASQRLLDVKTLPNDPNYVFVCGTAKSGSAFKGIAYSTNAGATWVLPGITPSPTDPTISVFNTFYEISTVEYVSGGNTYVKVYVCGDIGSQSSSPVCGVYVWDSFISAQPAFVQCPAVPGLTGDHVTSIHFKTHLEGVIGLGTGIGASVARVMKTNDGGTTWLPTTSLALTNSIANKYKQVGIFRDGNLIIAANQSTILKSTDGGSTWTQVYCWGGNVCNFSGTIVTSGRHLTWNIDANGTRKFWATGENNEIVVSTDNGSTWSVFNSHSYTSITPPAPYPKWNAAHFYTPSNGFTGAIGAIGSGLNNDQNINIWQVLGTTESISDSATTISEINIAISAIWTNYEIPKCYRLHDCEDLQSDVYTQTNLSQYVGDVITNITINNTVSLSCWEVFDEEPCNQNSIVSIGLTNVDVYTGQNACQNCITGCFKLIECEAPYTETIIFAPPSLNFQQYIYQTIQSDFCPGKCLYVVEAESCDNAVQFPTDVEITAFRNCFECRGVPPPEDLHPRRIKPGFYTPGCPPDYTVKTSCMYGEQVYDEMVAKRYGITICCDHDIDKWDIKMQLLQLKAIYDECLCQLAATTSCPCTAPCNMAGVATAYITQVPVEPEPPCSPPTQSNVTFEPISLCYQVSFKDSSSSPLFTFTYVREITIYGNTYNITSLITAPVTSPLFPAQMVTAIQSLGYQCSGVYVSPEPGTYVYILGIDGYVNGLTFQDINGDDPASAPYDTLAEAIDCFDPLPYDDCYTVDYAFGASSPGTNYMLSLTLNNGTSTTTYNSLPFNINIGAVPNPTAVAAYINGIPGYTVGSVIITNTGPFAYRMNLINFTGGYPVAIYPSLPALPFPPAPGYYFKYVECLIP
jgi:hypothetical protein